MMLSRSSFLSLTAFMLIALGAPEMGLAATRIVNPADSTCSTSTTPPCYTSITAALAAAASSDVIDIHPGTYTGTYTITQQLTIQGTETARTILSGGGSGPIFTISGVGSVTIRRLSFTNTTTGISATGSTINVTNNIFKIGTAGTAVELDASSTGNIINNTFYQNLTAISFASGAVMDIENNIFYGTGTGSTAISSSAAATTLQYNNFFNITAGQTGTAGDVTTNPQFVSPGTDFHLLAGSPCINVGTTSCATLCGADKIPDSVDSTASDMGAYGGPQSDTIPFPVSGLIAADVSVLPPPYSVQLTWNANLCYQVLGYKVRTGTASGSYAAPDNIGNVTTSTVAGLTAASAPTGAPVLTNDIANQTLLLTWTTGGVSGATGYEIRYSDTVTPPLTPIVDAGNTMFYALTGLTNNTSYYVSVTPYAQRTYYFTVTAYYNAADANYESAYSSEASIPIGPKVYGASSNIIHDYPEPITPIPSASNNGCFIATAAYGHYSAPQVQALREFRDRYLMTNELGRAFVRWYYRYGPIGAEFIQAHPWLKPIVRVTLLPLVASALFMTQTSYVTKALAVLFLGCCILSVILAYRERNRSV